MLSCTVFVIVVVSKKPDAIASGVQPTMFSASTWAPLSSSSSAMRSQPVYAAAWSAVSPTVLAPLTSTPASMISRAAASAWRSAWMSAPIA